MERKNEVHWRRKKEKCKKNNNERDLLSAFLFLTYAIFELKFKSSIDAALKQSNPNGSAVILILRAEISQGKDG